MVLADVINDMNSNYGNRKHGGNSHVFDMQEKIFSAFPKIGVENIFASEMYLPIGQKFEPGTLESLKAHLAEYQAQNVMESSSKTLN